MDESPIEGAGPVDWWLVAGGYIPGHVGADLFDFSVVPDRKGPLGWMQDTGSARSAAGG